MQGCVASSFGFSATAVTTVSILMMLAEPRLPSHALICSSITLALASIKILTFSGFGIFAAHSLYRTRLQSPTNWAALKPRDAAVQVVFIRALDFRGDDLADPQGTAA